MNEWMKNARTGLIYRLNISPSLGTTQVSIYESKESPGWRLGCNQWPTVFYTHKANTFRLSTRLKQYTIYNIHIYTMYKYTATSLPWMLIFTEADVSGSKHEGQTRCGRSLVQKYGIRWREVPGPSLLGEEVTCGHSGVETLDTTDRVFRRWR